MYKMPGDALIFQQLLSKLLYTLGLHISISLFGNIIVSEANTQLANK